MIHRLLVAFILAGLLAAPASGAELRLTVKGVRSDNGEILIALYDDPKGYESALATACPRLPNS